MDRIRWWRNAVLGAIVVALLVTAAALAIVMKTAVTRPLASLAASCRRITEGDFGKQFDQAMVTFRKLVEDGGGSMRTIVKVNMLLTRPQDVAEMNERYAKAFGPAPYPARTTSIVLALPDPRMLLEIEAVVGVVSRP